MKKRPVFTDRFNGKDIFEDDVFLLFGDFYYDFTTPLPIPITDIVSFESSPQWFLDTLDPPEQASFVLPGYKLPGMGIVHCCLKSNTQNNSISFSEIQEHFFDCITSFRLQAPMHIHTSGAFTVSSKSQLTNMHLYSLLTSWNPLLNFRYSGIAIEQSAIIAQRIRELRKIEPLNITDAYRIFQHVTVGYGRSWHMVYLALWSCLEFIFKPSVGKHSRHHLNLADRLMPFLIFFDEPETIHTTIINEYKNRRHQRVHGLVPFTSSSLNNQSNGSESENDTGINPIGLLHEMARLSILLLLNLPDDLIIEHSALKKQHITDWFMDLDFTELRFGVNQRSFTDEKSWIKENISPLGLVYRS